MLKHHQQLFCKATVLAKKPPGWGSVFHIVAAGTSATSD